MPGRCKKKHFESQAQRRMMWATDPELAREMEDRDTKKAKRRLPEHVDNVSGPLVLHTGSKRVVCNIWTQEARDAALEARQQKRGMAQKLGDEADRMSDLAKGVKQRRDLGASIKAFLDARASHWNAHEAAYTAGDFELAHHHMIAAVEAEREAYELTDSIKLRKAA